MLRAASSGAESDTHLLNIEAPVGSMLGLDPEGPLNDHI